MITIFFVSIMLIGICSLPTVTAFIEEQKMQRDFPLINSFERHFETARWEDLGSKITRTSVYATHGMFSLEINLGSGKYPGISTQYFFRNWQDYETLAFDIFLAENGPLEIVVRINDKEHNNDYYDRYNKTIELKPELNEVAIPLKDVMNSPKKRTMNMNNIARILIFSRDLKRKRTFFIDNIRLLKSTLSPTEES